MADVNQTQPQVRKEDAPEHKYDWVCTERTWFAEQRWLPGDLYHGANFNYHPLPRNKKGEIVLFIRTDSPEGKELLANPERVAGVPTIALLASSRGAVSSSADVARQQRDEILGIGR